MTKQYLVLIIKYIQLFFTSHFRYQKSQFKEISTIDLKENKHFESTNDHLLSRQNIAQWRSNWENNIFKYDRLAKKQ